MTEHCVLITVFMIGGVSLARAGSLVKMYRTQNCLFILGLLLLLVACTPPTPPPSPTPWPSPTATAAIKLNTTPRTLSTPTPRPTPNPTSTRAATTVILWESLPEAQAQQLAADIQAFQVEFPHYHVQLQHYDSPETFMTPLMAGQFNFDVVLASPPLLGNLWTAKRIAPMADFFPPSFIDGFAAVTLAGATRDGQVWGLPDTTGFHLLLFYNEDLVDAPPTNTRQLAELAENLTQEARWGLGVNSYDPLWLVPWLTPFGGELTDETGHPTLDTPAMIEALSLFASWQTGSPAIAPIQTYDEMRARFLSGNIAMLIDGDWSIGELEQVGRVEWGVAPLPTISESQDGQPAAPLVLGRYWAISPAAAAGDRALAAAAFLEFMTRPERQLAWTRQFGLLPTHREALGAPLIINDPVLRTSAAQMQAGRPMLLGVNTNRLLDAMREPLQGVINGELTPEEAAELMQANAEQP